MARKTILFPLCVLFSAFFALNLNCGPSSYCAEGEKKCDGNTAMVCRVDKTGFDSTNCSDTQVCKDGACVAKECEPGQKKCDGDTVMSCENGSWESTECEDGKTCQQGACVTGTGSETTTEDGGGTDSGSPEVGPEPKPEQSTGSCTTGEKRACYTGPDGTKGVGECKEGSQTCTNGTWGTCTGDIKPATESCDSKDNDCDGKVDNPTSASGCQASGKICLTTTQTCVNGKAQCTCNGSLQEVKINSGNFMMGAPGGEPGASLNERPVHSVTISYSFNMFKYEVTQDEFNAVMGYNPSKFKACGGTCPVENVNWHEAVAFCNALSQSNGLPTCFACTGKGDKVKCLLKNAFKGNNGKDLFKCKGFRLPSEAEWEYAARAGTTAATYGDLPTIAWYNDNSANTSHPIGKKTANAWNLHDMLGNVAEWTFFGQYSYSRQAATNPVGDLNLNRMLRGGGWNTPRIGLRAASRRSISSLSRGDNLGFRPVRTL